MYFRSCRVGKKIDLRINDARHTAAVLPPFRYTNSLKFVGLGRGTRCSAPLSSASSRRTLVPVRL